MKNYYQILGIEKDSSQSDIKKAFRSLAFKWHPDRNKSDDALSRFLDVSEAFNILQDSEKRKAYDILLNKDKMEAGFSSINNNQEFAKYQAWEREARSRAKEQSNKEFNDFLKGVKGVSIGIFDIIGYLFIFWLYISWGPEALFTILSDLNVENLDIQGVIVTIIFLVISTLVTLSGLYVIFILLKKLFEDNNKP